MPTGVYERTEWHREINRKAHIRQVVSAEAKGKMSVTRKGRKFSIKHRENISKALKGRKINSQTRKKHSKTLLGITYEQKFGKERALAIKKKQSIAKLGKTSITEEGRKKLKMQMTGKNNPVWNGGSSCEPYCKKFSLNYKEKIRDRDKRVCAMCNKKEAENEKLSIHHIDYDRKNTAAKNCVSLHRGCHTKTLMNRKKWKKYFSQYIQEVTE